MLSPKHNSTHTFTLVRLAGAVALATLAACHDLSVTLPVGTSDPNNYKDPESARAMYRAALALYQEVSHDVILTAGTLTDELQTLVTTGTPSYQPVTAELDDRRAQDASALQKPYQQLQRLRGQTRQAIGALATYAPTDSSTRARAYILAGYAEIWLADLYCSGIPLSTLDFEGDYTYRPGASTIDVYTHALTQFDTALALSRGDISAQMFARVGKGRALLALGNDTAAATVVAVVPDNFREIVQWRALLILFTPHAKEIDPMKASVEVADREGGIGFPYRSSHDPRTRTNVYVDTVESFPNTLYYLRAFPQLFSPYGEPAPHTIASGIEARLIEAEAALRRQDMQWLTILNALRTTGGIDNISVVTDTTYTVDETHRELTVTMTNRIDTVWHAGTGGVAGLRPLVDPGSDAARVSLLFAERAAWLFLTGQRQSDLRRLIRQYRRPAAQVYPSQGLSPSHRPYGNGVVIPIAPSEEAANPYFHGCLNDAA